MRTYDPARYTQDAEGQWWYLTKSNGRTRAYSRKCARCGEEFLYSAVHKTQRFCSQDCGNRSRVSAPLATVGVTDQRIAGTRAANRYLQDETGQWWYHWKGQRTRAKVKTCEHCGADYPVSNQSYAKSRYCSRGCATRAYHATHDVSGPNARRWKRGETRRKGYVLVYAPDHHSIPPGSQRKYVLQHRLVMEEALGRPLSPIERVHHVNGVKDDNRPENLELWVLGHPPGQREAEQKHCPTCTCGDHT